MVRNQFPVFLFSCLLLTSFSHCKSGQEVDIDCKESDLQLTLVRTVNSGCGPSGLIEVEASGGGGSYEFSKDGSNFQSDPIFDQLAGGSYTISVRDGNDCLITMPVSVSSGENGVTGTVQATEAGCETTQGTIVVTASGGTGTYTYRLNNGGFQEDSVFSGLDGGNYTVTIRDEAGCISQVSTEVVRGTSLSDEIMPLIEANCAVANCHGNPKDPDAPYQLTRALVMANAPAIKDVIRATDSFAMPPPDSEYSLTKSERDLIVCWIDDGAQDN